MDAEIANVIEVLNGAGSGDEATRNAASAQLLEYLRAPGFAGALVVRALERLSLPEMLNGGRGELQTFRLNLIAFASRVTELFPSLTPVDRLHIGDPN